MEGGTSLETREGDLLNIEKFLRGTMYESSYRNVAQHADKLVEAGIARVVKDPVKREKLVDLEKIIKIETLDVKSGGF